MPNFFNSYSASLVTVIVLRLFIRLMRVQIIDEAIFTSWDKKMKKGSNTIELSEGEFALICKIWGYMIRRLLIIILGLQVEQDMKNLRKKNFGIQVINYLEECQF